MLFSSVTFLFFFLPFTVAAYFVAPTMALKNAVLLLLSLLFYAWGEPAFVLVLAAAIVFNYGAALVIDAQAGGGGRKIALTISVVINLSLLAFFKYLTFIISNLGWFTHYFGVRLLSPAIPLPLGISFFTFHCLSYLIDAYRGRFPANRRLGEVALYVALFPQLVAGPIVRYRLIARQLRKRRHSLGRASAGLQMFVIGLSQKLLIADQLAPLAQAVFDRTHRPSLADAWIGALAYTLQIYFDFAGYSNMAIGLGLVFGFTLPRNFDMPYQSRSITEFWRRWHISLSSWLRDYLYIPLGGSRGGPRRTYRNLVVVFLLCGLWHGASWTFVLWGAWHGVFLVIERAVLSRQLARAPAPLAWAYAATAVSAGWVLFRAPSLGAAVDVWQGMLGLNGAGRLGPALASALQPVELAILAVGAALAVAPIGRRRSHNPWTSEVEARHGLTTLAPVGVSRRASPWGVLEAPGLLVLLALCVLQVSVSAYSPFLYFRF